MANRLYNSMTKRLYNSMAKRLYNSMAKRLYNSMAKRLQFHGQETIQKSLIIFIFSVISSKYFLQVEPLNLPNTLCIICYLKALDDS